MKLQLQGFIPRGAEVLSKDFAKEFQERYSRDTLGSL
jgi:hypothetical protein